MAALGVLRRWSLRCLFSLMGAGWGGDGSVLFALFFGSVCGSERLRANNFLFVLLAFCVRLTTFPL